MSNGAIAPRVAFRKARPPGEGDGNGRAVVPMIDSHGQALLERTRFPRCPSCLDSLLSAVQLAWSC
jgi:hypothetical protein